MKNKKFLSALVSVAMIICSVFSINTVLADDSVTFDYNAETSTLTVIGTGAMDNYTENSLNSRLWAAYSDSTTKVVISEGVTSIGDYAFSRFSALEEVVIPDTVTSIGTTAFGGDDSLLSIAIPGSVTAIGDYAFGYDFEMNVPEGFIAYATPNSEAVRYCVKNYISFECPMVDKAGTAHITASGGQQAMWSFVAPANGTVSFWSTGTKDTYGLVYDANTYSYSTKFSQMRDTAIAKNDDNGGDVNFRVVAKVEAGKRYYLAAKFAANNRYDGYDSYEDGQFEVAYSFICDEEAHSYSVTDEEQPTCTAGGFTEYTCDACGYSYTETLDPAAHTAGEAVKENEIEPTCLDEGTYDEVVYCIECTEEISREQKTTDPLGHKFSNYVSNDNATCTANATETAICDRCDQTDTRDIEDSELGHNYVPTVTNSTCTERGYTTYNCSRCEASYVDNYTDPLGHTNATPVVENTVKATCTVDGSYDEVVYCTVCTSEVSRTTKPIKANGHTEGEMVVENKVAATCENDGSYDEVVYCSVCETELSRDTKTDKATGHEYAITAFDGVTVVTTCSKCTGEVTYEFMDWYNVVITEENIEGAILDVNEDGIINAKDFAKIVKMLAVVE